MNTIMSSLHERNTCHDGTCSGVSSSDVVWVAVAAALCGTVVLALAGIYIVRRIKANRRQRVSMAPSPQMTSAAAPLLSFSRPTLERAWHSTSSEPLYSPVSPSSSDYHDSASAHSHSSSSISSPNSDSFHFPILSADGHLLPPVPASSRSAHKEATEGDLGLRPLPLSPADQTASPSPSLRQPDIQSKAGAAVRGYTPLPSTLVGLYPQDEQWELKLNSTAPQRATFYRSFSAEGEEMVDADVVDHRRW